MAKSAKKVAAKPKQAIAAEAPPTPVAETEASFAPAKPKTGMTLHELCTAILSDAHAPTPDEIKVLATSVLKHSKPNKDKKAKKAKAKDGKKDKPKAEKKGKSSSKKSNDKEPKIRLPKLRSA